jgi:hypothetical protein
VLEGLSTSTIVERRGALGARELETVALAQSHPEPKPDPYLEGIRLLLRKVTFTPSLD